MRPFVRLIGRIADLDGDALAEPPEGREPGMASVNPSLSANKSRAFLRRTLRSLRSSQTRAAGRPPFLIETQIT